MRMWGCFIGHTEPVRLTEHLRGTRKSEQKKRNGRCVFDGDPLVAMKSVTGTAHDRCGGNHSEKPKVVSHHAAPLQDPGLCCAA